MVDDGRRAGEIRRAELATGTGEQIPQSAR
jgi:hypothetical protein